MLRALCVCVFALCGFALCNNYFDKDLIKSVSLTSGYGDLWDDIQKLEENDKGSSVHGLSGSSDEAGGSKESSQLERRDDSSDWKSEDEDIGDEEDNTDDEDYEEKGTFCSC